jgi:hypothetical protein
MSDFIKLKIDNHFQNVSVLKLYWELYFNSNQQFSKTQMARIKVAFRENQNIIDEMRKSNLDAYTEEDWSNFYTS